MEDSSRLLVASVRMLVLVALKIFLSGVAVPCTSDLDCSLNGICRTGLNRTGSGPALPASCSCDAAWAGPKCETLSLLPTGATGDLRLQRPEMQDHAYINPSIIGSRTSASSLRNVSTWGMSVLWHGGQYHGFFAEMVHG